MSFTNKFSILNKDTGEVHDIAVRVPRRVSIGGNWLMFFQESLFDIITNKNVRWSAWRYWVWRTVKVVRMNPPPNDWWSFRILGTVPPPFDGARCMPMELLKGKELRKWNPETRRQLTSLNNWFTVWILSVQQMDNYTTPSIHYTYIIPTE